MSIGKEEDKMGIRASATAEIIFDDCFVPESARVGKRRTGFPYRYANIASVKTGGGSYFCGYR